MLSQYAETWDGHRRNFLLQTGIISETGTRFFVSLLVIMIILSFAQPLLHNNEQHLYSYAFHAPILHRLKRLGSKKSAESRESELQNGIVRF
jgi:hypothetical protein